MINLAYYKNKILSKYPDVKRRDLMLRYLEGMPLDTNDELHVLHLIANIIHVGDKEIVLNSIPEYEMWIELEILMTPNGEYSKREDETLLKMKREGSTNDEVASALRRSRASVSARYNQINDKNKK